jgi:MYXO-CTERM domain-containing protein
VCAPVCATACSGSCTGKANIDCQVSCQSDLYAACKPEVVEECKTECTNTGAAIFCDGQFLATGGNLQACADELEAEFNVTLDVSLSASCDDGGCEGSADGKSSGFGCSVASVPNPADGSRAGGLMVLIGLGLVCVRRNRRSV